MRFWGTRGISVRQLGQSPGQNERSAGDIFGRRKLVGTMAVALTTRDEQHACRGNAGHKKRIVIRAAYHFLERQVVLVARANEGVLNDGRTDGRRVSIDDLELNGYATSLRDTMRFVLNSL